MATVYKTIHVYVHHMGLVQLAWVTHISIYRYTCSKGALDINALLIVLVADTEICIPRGKVVSVVINQAKQW